MGRGRARGKDRAIQARAGQLTVRNRQLPQELPGFVWAKLQQSDRAKFRAPGGTCCSKSTKHGRAELNVGKMPAQMNMGSHLMEFSRYTCNCQISGFNVSHDQLLQSCRQIL